MRKITINDIAEMSGVSKGTVDRVLHNRLDVSEKTRQKVLKIVKDIGYETNIYASALATKRKTKIIAMIPSFQQGDYWSMINEGIVKAADRVKSFNVDLDVMLYNQFDVKSFVKTCRNIRELEPQGVVIAPLYKEESEVFIHELMQFGISVVCIDTRLDNVSYLSYYGMPQRHSGYLAANILFGDEPQSHRREVVNFNFNNGVSTKFFNETMYRRLQGFMQYIEDNEVNCEVKDCTLFANNTIDNIKILNNFFEQNPNVNDILVLNSRAYIVGEWMELNNIRDKKIIAFETIERNLEAVRKGYISTLIGTKTSHQAYLAVEAISNYLLFRHLPENKDNLTSIDILNRYNVEFY